MSEQQLRREIQSLTDKLASAGLARKSKKKRSKPVQSSSQAAAMSIGTSRARKSRKGRRSVDGASGTITLERREIMYTISTTDSTFASHNIELRPESFTFLKKFDMFDRFRFNRLKLYYKPMVSSTTSGAVMYGIEWDMTAGAPADRAAISALSPVRSHACWFDGEQQALICPPARLHTRPWFSVEAPNKSEDRGPGILVIGANGPSSKVTLVDITPIVKNYSWRDTLQVEFFTSLTGGAFTSNVTHPASQPVGSLLNEGGETVTALVPYSGATPNIYPKVKSFPTTAMSATGGGQSTSQPGESDFRGWLHHNILIRVPEAVAVRLGLKSEYRIRVEIEITQAKGAAIDTTGSPQSEKLIWSVNWGTIFAVVVPISTTTTLSSPSYTRLLSYVWAAGLREASKFEFRVDISAPWIDSSRHHGWSDWYISITLFAEADQTRIRPSALLGGPSDDPDDSDSSDTDSEFEIIP